MNNYAISTADLATSLTKSSGSLVAANGTLEEAVALTATANTIIQDADVVGTALKTVAMRLRGTDTKTMEEEGLDTDGAVTSTSKLRGKIQALSGVDILTDTGAYKSTYQILSEIADVWEDINDMDQAALLELLAGKRAGSVMSAILQNPETLKDAFESASDAAGSALTENEKYLDSIQGRIDLFNNAVQTMWKNAIDDEFIKDIVNLGTELIKIVDTLGLIPSILVALGAYKGFGALFKGFQTYAPSIKTVWQYINQLTVGFKGFTVAQMKANAATTTSQLVNSQYTAGLIRTNLIQWLTQKSTQALEDAKYQLKLAEMGLAAGTAKAADVQAAQAAVQAASIPGDYAKMTTTQLLGASFKALTASIWGTIKAIAAFLFTNPVGWFILAIGAIAGGIAIFNHFHKTTEELAEDLENLKSELQDIQSELDSVNAELETTRDRMAELLAMPSLSFTDEEELNKLKKQNDELEREQYLLEQRQKRKQKEAEDTFDKMMWGEFNRGTNTLGVATSITEAQVIRAAVGMYKSELEAGNTKQAEKYRKIIDDELTTYLEAADGIDYDLADDETKRYLDFIYNIEDSLNILSGDDKAKSMAITRIFNQEAFEDDLEVINGYVDALKNGDESAKQYIDNFINNNTQLQDVVKGIDGLELQDVVDYFTLEGQGFNSTTFDGILTQYEKGEEVLRQMMSSTNFEQDWGEFFTKDDEGVFKARTDKFGEILEGMDEEARKTFIGVVESAVNGAEDLNNIDWNKALSSFNVSGIINATKVLEAQFQELNNSVFKGLDDEISGFIDTFSELGAALEDVASSMDILNTAQKQMANSGQISVKTALELIESTDRWDEVLTVTNGTIQLTSNAEDVLVQSKLNVIKANIDESLTSAELQLQQLGTADSTLLAASATDVTSEAYAIYHNAMTSYTASIAAFGAAIDALMSGNITGVFGAARSAHDASKQITTEQDKVSADALRNRIKDLRAQKSLLEKVGTTGAFKDYYDYDETPGDKDTSSGSASDKSDKFQKAMSYYENRIGAEQSRLEQVQNEVDLLEAQGKKAGEGYYDEQIASENRRLQLLEQQKAEAQKYLKQFKTGSDEWWEVANTLNDIENNIDDVTSSLQDLNDALAEVNWYKFEEPLKRFDDYTDTLETIRTLVAPNNEEDWFDDEGQWTEKGVTVAGTYVQEIEMDKQSLADTQKTLAKLSKPYEGNEEYYKSLDLGIDSEQDLYDKRLEYQQKEQKLSKDIVDNGQNLANMYKSQIDAIENWADKAIEAYNDYIEVVQEALDAERD